MISRGGKSRFQVVSFLPSLNPKNPVSFNNTSKMSGEKILTFSKVGTRKGVFCGV
jgi:hypothetical protein